MIYYTVKLLIIVFDFIMCDYVVVCVSPNFQVLLKLGLALKNEDLISLYYR